MVLESLGDRLEDRFFGKELGVDPGFEFGGWEGLDHVRRIKTKSKAEKEGRADSAMLDRRSPVRYLPKSSNRISHGCEKGVEDEITSTCMRSEGLVVL